MYKNKELILYNQGCQDYISIISNIFIYSCSTSLLLEDIKFPLFIVLIPFS